MNRRTFIKRSIQGAAAVTLWRNAALSAQNVIGANDRINIGLIGCGGRGLLVSRLMAGYPKAV